MNVFCEKQAQIWAIFHSNKIKYSREQIVIQLFSMDQLVQFTKPV